MSYPGWNYTVKVRGTRGNKQLWARDIKVHIFDVQNQVIMDPYLQTMRFRYGMLFDQKDTLARGTPDESPIRMGDVLFWDEYKGQELGLSHISVEKGGIGGFRVTTAYFMPVSDEGEGGT